MNKTIEYYETNAREYFEETVVIDVNELYERFLKYIPVAGKIVDIGCGSGRDMKAFKLRGYQVEGIDASAEMCGLARQFTEEKVICEDINSWNPDEKYNGIWACASLLHLNNDDISAFFNKAKEYLEPGGVIFVSAKNGIRTGEAADGRYFTDFNEEFINRILSENNEYQLMELWYTSDTLDRNDFRWLSFIIKMKN